MERVTRRARDARPAKATARLTPRDGELLTFLGRCRAAPTDLLAAVFFGDRSTASRRLAKLLALRLVRVCVPALNAPNWYSLSSRGVAWLTARGVDEASLFEARFSVGESLEHLRRINELRAAFVVECRDRPQVSLELFLADHDLRRLAGPSTPAYVPDAIVRLRTAGGVPGYALEVDLGHETATRIAVTKGRATRAIVEAGQPLWGVSPWRPVFVAPSAARLRSVARALDAEGVAPLWLCSEFSRLAEVGVLGEAYLTAAQVVATPRASALLYASSLIT